MDEQFNIGRVYERQEVLALLTLLLETDKELWPSMLESWKSQVENSLHA